MHVRSLPATHLLKADRAPTNAGERGRPLCDRSTPLSADKTSAHYSSLRIRQTRKEKMRYVYQCCKMLISRGLDHSHWFFCLSVCTACGVEHSGGRCLHCRWLLCGQGGSLRVDDTHSTDISTCGWRAALHGFSEGAAETLTCYVTSNVPFYHSSAFCIKN